ncbi:TetR/AcrR family transcriptional regulator [Photobacterium sp. CCB-ST2H9]|uniref:LuxR family transcriptional regulator n=1 Tax=Photobacterium galatheae TaxID=1654360 RepID=A0A066RQK8_9GAMM|nr:MULTISPECIES: TetR/AcrR family transcriptional regulator [Photobacterium]KDM92705.1 LuxR family transcriptional regulator [Photobacterium galatheae]MCM0149377.1 TetR/AcrR family transcriptional regulator [Photobacterium galatheae]UTM57731.1 TetR/AcrR family transcriptional regulator [Photobacterium sp. CCB-ST2H9]
MDTIVKKTRTRLSPEKRKQQLLKCALEVFARRGIGRAGHADIADMANVSVATVFNYFPTREALVEQVLYQVERKFNELLNLCLGEEHDTIHGHLSCITGYLIDAVIEQQDWLKVWFEWSTSVRTETWPQFLDANQPNLKQVTNIFELGKQNGQLSTDIASYDLTWLLHGLCYVLYLRANIEPNKDSMQAQADAYISLMFP